MDIIDCAIRDQLHISVNGKFNGQTWKSFFEASKGKKVFLFGHGYASCFFMKHYSDKADIQGIIDNNAKKQGYCLGDYMAEMVDTAYEHIEIVSIDALKKYAPDETVVLITSTKFYEQIATQLETAGYDNYFVMLLMEADKRKREPYHVDADNMYIEKISYITKCCEMPIEIRKLVFYSFGTYSDHGKYITQALLKMSADFDIVWILDDLSSEVPNTIRKIYSGNWKRVIKEIETAKVWIYNMPVPSYFIKRKGQFYIQTKHWASVTLKKFYLDSVTIQNVSKDVENWRYNSEIMDYIITGSRFDTESCRRGFGFHKEIKQFGSPRTDAMFREQEYRKKICEHYHIESDMKLLIYAPTYRFAQSSHENKHESREVDIDFVMLKNSLERKFGGKWCILLRLHPSVAKEGAKMADRDFIIDACNYPDSEELVSASDIMISDYSSIMFESAFVNKPVFLYAADRKNYIDKEYDLLIKYDTLPFPIAESNAELTKLIESFDYDAYKRDLDEFFDKYDVCEDGHASERAALFISELLDGSREVCPRLQ